MLSSYCSVCFFCSPLADDFPLYPAMKSDSHYRDLSEYYLLLRNLQITGR